MRSLLLKGQKLRMDRNILKTKPKASLDGRSLVQRQSGWKYVPIARAKSLARHKWPLSRARKLCVLLGCKNFSAWEVFYRTLFGLNICLAERLKGLDQTLGVRSYFIFVKSQNSAWIEIQNSYRFVILQSHGAKVLSDDKVYKMNCPFWTLYQAFEWYSM